MKRLTAILTTVAVVFAFMAMTSNVQAQSDNATYSFSVEVLPAIEFAPANTSYDVTMQGGDNSRSVANYAEAGHIKSNCPTELSFQGSALSREENGPGAEGTDVLTTTYAAYVVNTEEVGQPNPNTGNWPGMKALQAGGLTNINMESLPSSHPNFYPHEGSIDLVIYSGVSSEWRDDAGTYSGELMITATALGSYDDGGLW